jgi:hypothetical protein
MPDCAAEGQHSGPKWVALVYMQHVSTHNDLKGDTKLKAPAKKIL